MPKPIITDKKDRTIKGGKWADRVYSKQLVEYIDQSLKPEEKGVYKSLFDALTDQFKIRDANDVMMLDVALFDFIRIKRIQNVIIRDGDFYNIRLRNGQTIKKSTDASFLLNAVESQFRQNMKELMLTRKELMKKKLGVDAKDFSTFMSEAVDITPEDETEDDNDKEDKKDGNKQNENTTGQVRGRVKGETKKS